MIIKYIKSFKIKKSLTYFTLSSFVGFSLFGIGYTIQQIKKRDEDNARTILLTDDRSYNPRNPSSVHNNIGPLFQVLFKNWILSFGDEVVKNQNEFLKNSMNSYVPKNPQARPFFGNITQIQKDLEIEKAKKPNNEKETKDQNKKINDLNNKLKNTEALQEYITNQIFDDTNKLLNNDQKKDLSDLAKKVKDHNLKFEFSENYGSIFKLNDGLQQGVEGQKILPNLMFLYSDNFYNFYNNLWRNKYPLGLPGTQNNKDIDKKGLNIKQYISNIGSIVNGIYQNSADPNDKNVNKNAELLMVPFGKSFSNFMFVNKGLLAEMLYILGKEELIFDSDDKNKKGFEIKGIKSWNDFQNLSFYHKENNRYPYTPSLAPLYFNKNKGIFTPLSRLTPTAFKELGLEHYKNLNKESLTKIFDDPMEYAKFSTIIYKLVWWQYEYNKAFYKKYIDKKTIKSKDGKYQNVYSYKNNGNKDHQDYLIKEKVLSIFPNSNQEDYFKNYFNKLLDSKTNENFYALGNDDITGSFYLQFVGEKNGKFLYKEYLNKNDHKYKKGKFTFNISDNESKIKSYLEFMNQFKKPPKIKTTEQDWPTHFGGLYMRNFQRSGQAYGSDWFTRGKMLASLGSTAGLYQLLKGNKANPNLLWAKPDMVFSGKKRSLMSGPNLAVLEHKEGLLNNIWNTLMPTKNKISLYFATFSTMPNINRIINANMSYFPIHEKNWRKDDVVLTFKYLGLQQKRLNPQQEIYSNIVGDYGQDINNLIVEHKVSSLGQELRGIFNFVFNDYYVDKMYLKDKKEDLGRNAEYSHFIDSLKSRVSLIKKNAIVNIEYV